MPHSSGGGSHDGGFSSGSDSGSSSGGISGISTSKTYSSGCNTYIYYRDDGPHYVYSHTDLKHPERINLFSAIFVILFMSVWYWACIKVTFPKIDKLEGTENYEIIISDKANVFDDTTELMEALKEFKEKSGITPAIFTVYNETWKNTYEDLYSYGYKLYVNNFKDEKHWLIVYSVPYGEDKFDWSWHGIQGNDTDGILTPAKDEKYTEIIHTNLLKDTFYTDTQAFTESFNTINETIMERPGIDIFAIVIFWAFTLGFTALLIPMFFPFAYKPFKKKELCKVKKSAIDKKTGKSTNRYCEYCGGLYVVGAHLSCPHCGGSLRAQNIQTEEDE